MLFANENSLSLWDTRHTGLLMFKSVLQLISIKIICKTTKLAEYSKFTARRSVYSGTVTQGSPSSESLKWLPVEIKGGDMPYQHFLFFLEISSGFLYLITHSATCLQRTRKRPFSFVRYRQVSCNRRYLNFESSGL